MSLLAVVLVGLLVSSDRADAFAVAVGNVATTPRSPERPSVPQRVLILPDSRAEVANRDLWHHHLKASVLSNIHTQLNIVQRVVCRSTFCLSSVGVL